MAALVICLRRLNNCLEIETGVRDRIFSIEVRPYAYTNDKSLPYLMFLASIVSESETASTYFWMGLILDLHVLGFKKSFSYID